MPTSERAKRIETERRAALDRYDILETPPENTFDIVTSMVAEMFEVPQSCVSLVASSRVWFKSRIGVEVCEVPREPGFCSTLIESDEVVRHIEDAATNPETRHNSLVQMEGGIRFYIGVALTTPEGHRIGTLCAFGPVPRGLSEGERRFLCSAADLVMHEIELRKARQELARTEAALRQAQRLEGIGMIAGGVAHDFNNMLGVILGNAALLRNNLAEDSSDLKMLDELETTAQRAVSLVDQVFTFAGRGEESPAQPIDLNRVVRETWRMLSASRPVHAAVDLDLAASLPSVLGQSIGLRQVVMNLITNAIEACGEHGHIRVVTTTTDHGAVSLTVSDDGPGMTDETCGRVFEPFFTSKSSGHGLGLAIVQRIVEHHEGTVSVDAAPGAGCTFVVTLPTADAAVKASTPGPVEVVPKENATILVVDDEEFILSLARRCLERVGYRVRMASGGAEAIELLDAHAGTIDAVVLDWSMPVVSGDAVLEVLRQRHPAIPVILSSGHQSAYSSEHVAAFSIRWAVRKPYRPDQLTKTVTDALAAVGHDTNDVRH